MPTQIQYAQQIAGMVDAYMLRSGASAQGDNYMEISDMSKLYGWTVLGKGHFSCVITHPFNDDLAIKIVLGAEHRSNGRSVHLCDGYMDFVAAVMQAPKSKHLPEFHAAVVQKRCAVVVMRRYLPSASAPSGIDRSAIDFMTGCRISHEDAGLTYIHGKLGRATDLHSGNYMWDEDNRCFVITDPYAYTTPDRNLHVERMLGRDGQVVVDMQVHREERGRTADFQRELERHEMANRAHMDFAAIENRMLAAIGAPMFFKQNPHLIRKSAFLRENADMEREVRKLQAHGMAVGRVAHKMPNTGLWFDEDKRAFIDRTQIERKHLAPIKLRGFRPEVIVMDTVRKEIADVRPEVADGGEKPSLRDEEKDHVLQLRAKYDCGAHIAGFPIVLLSGQGSRRVPTARPAEHCGHSQAKGSSREPADKPVDGPADRLYAVDTAKGDDMVAKVFRWIRHGGGIQDRLLG